MITKDKRLLGTVAGAMILAAVTGFGVARCTADPAAAPAAEGEKEAASEALPSSLAITPEAIKAAAAGQVQLSPQVVERLLREVKAPESPQRLGDYEQEVLRLVARGRSNNEIAQTLHVGEKTVKTLVGGILSKLGVPSRTQAALYALRVGLVSMDETAL